ncbi:MAG: oligoendopeptidase F [Lactococcus sp.]
MAKERNEIKAELLWDLTSVFKTDDEFEKKLSTLFAQVGTIESQYKGHTTASAQDLLKTVEAMLDFSRQIEKVYVYASMKNDQDTRVTQYQEYQAKVTSLYAKYEEGFAFFEPELLSISTETYATFVAEEPQLLKYSHFFERLFSKKAHVLSEKEEKLLAKSSEILGSAAEIFEILDNADIDFPVITDENGDQVQLTHGNFISFMESKNREVRKEAYQALYGIYAQYQHTYAKTLQTNVKVHNLNAEVHHYASAREAALSANFVPEKVYDVLIENVNKYLPLLHRYVQLRQQILGLPDLKMYDMYRPLSNLDYKFNYAQAVDKAQEVLGVFGDDYSKKVKAAFDEQWIDVEENVGKRSGAYSGGAYDTNAFMLLNWQETLDDVFTLVHEMGHSMHSAFTRASQPYVYGDYPIFLAEIASTTNENILTESLLDEAKDEKEQLAILNHWLDGFKGTVFRQAQFAEFEQEIHQADAAGQVLTSDFLNSLYGQLNEKYYGLKAEENPEIQYEWARIPHFYYNFYVFQYSTGFAAASFLAEKIVHGTAEDKEAYLNYLKAGSSDYPLNVIKKAGVDMESSEYLEAAFTLFEKRLKALEELVAKGVHID